jgi:hypothetical protein
MGLLSFRRKPESRGQKSLCPLVDPGLRRDDNSKIHIVSLKENTLDFGAIVWYCSPNFNQGATWGANADYPLLLE